MQPPWHCLPALPSIEGRALCHSPWHEERETEVIEEEEGINLNAPLTPQNEIDRLAEVIAPSTIFFGRKYCYRQIGDSISSRRWGSRLWSKGCVCPVRLRLQRLLMLCLSSPPSSFSLFLYPLLFHPPQRSKVGALLLLAFMCYYLITQNPWSISLPHPSIFSCSVSSGSLLTIFLRLKGNNSITQ